MLVKKKVDIILVISQTIKYIFVNIGNVFKFELKINKTLYKTITKQRKMTKCKNEPSQCIGISLDQRI